MEWVEEREIVSSHIINFILTFVAAGLARE